MQEQYISMSADGMQLDAVLALPERAVGVVLMVPCAAPADNGLPAISTELVRAGFATLRFTHGGAAPTGGVGQHAYYVHADIVLQARRMEAALEWLRQEPATRRLPCGLYGHGVAAAVVIQLAAWQGPMLAALAVCDAQAELAGKAALERVRVPSLLIVSGRDPDITGLNRMAFSALHCNKQLEQLAQMAAPGSDQARHQAALLACDWYMHHFNGQASMMA